MNIVAWVFVWALSVGSVAVAQQMIYVGPTTDVDIKWAQPQDFRADRFPFCRGSYTSVRYEANGSGFWTDYPGADQNFLVRLGELTTIRVGKPVVVRLDDPLLFQCPMVYLSDVGTMGLSPKEVTNVQEYLARGGFIWVDDFWGSEAWAQWLRTIRLVLPLNQMIAIDASHPVFHQLYAIDGIWQMPTTGIWAFIDDSGKRVTSERGDDSSEAHMRGITDRHGRLIVLMTHNTDIADGWEAAEQAENIEYFGEFSSRSYALGANVILYVLTH